MFEYWTKVHQEILAHRIGANFIVVIILLSAPVATTENGYIPQLYLLDVLGSNPPLRLPFLSQLEFPMGRPERHLSIGFPLRKWREGKEKKSLKNDSYIFCI